MNKEEIKSILLVTHLSNFEVFIFPCTHNNTLYVVTDGIKYFKRFLLPSPPSDFWFFNIELLNLSCSYDIIDISALPTMPLDNVKHISLKGNQFANIKKTIDILCSLHPPNLESIDLRWNNFSTEEIQFLRKNCKPSLYF